MRITLLIHAMGPGGAERVMAWLANGLVARGHEVHLWTLSGKVEESFYPLRSEVQVKHLQLIQLPRRSGKLWTLEAVFRLLHRLRTHMAAAPPEVIVVFGDTSNVMALMASVGLGIPVVVSERSDPRVAPLAWEWKVGRCLAYRWSAAVVVQTREVRDWFGPRIGGRAVVIPNPVVPAEELSARPAHDLRYRVLAVGRLGREKGFDLLLRAFANVSARFPDWDLEILGEGSERTGLESLRDSLGIGQRVSLPGTTKDVQARLRQADLFILSSRFEGFPNALCEAMACGLPVVATSCSGGVREIIRPGLDGLLVSPEDPIALAGAMARLMEDESLRRCLGSKAIEVTERYSIEAILGSWESCLQQASGRASAKT